MMTYYVETLELGVSILSDGVRKQFLVRPAADDDFKVILSSSLSTSRFQNYPKHFLLQVRKFPQKIV